MSDHLSHAAGAHARGIALPATPVSRLLAAIERAFAPSPGSLLSPAMDIIMAGGASIALYVAVRVFVPSNGALAAWAIAAYYASFVVNYPHFAASYRLLYADAGRDFFSWRAHPWFSTRLWWAGGVVPVVLAGYFLFALSTQNVELMGYLVNALYLTVGWHYVKQTFGCMVVLSSVRKTYYSRLERWSMLAPLYLLWALSYVRSNLSVSTGQYFGIPYTTFAFPHYLITYLYIALAATSALMIFMLVAKYVRSRSRPSVAALSALVSIYLWYLPPFGNIFYFYFIPFFHSFQYLLFVSAYERNRSLAEQADIEPSPALSRRVTFSIGALALALPALVIIVGLVKRLPVSVESYLSNLYGNLASVSPERWGALIFAAAFVALLVFLARARARRSAGIRLASIAFETVIVGALLFSFVPLALDILARNGLLPGALSYSTALFGSTLYIFFFTVFVNIHHYFVDNVLWRRDNPHIGRYLIQRPRPAPANGGTS